MTCVVHPMRCSLAHAAWKERRELAAAIRRAIHAANAFRVPELHGAPGGAGARPRIGTRSFGALRSARTLPPKACWHCDSSQNANFGSHRVCSLGRPRGMDSMVDLAAGADGFRGTTSPYRHLGTMVSGPASSCSIPLDNTR